MASKKGKITRADIIEGKVLSVGQDYAKSLDPAIKANKKWLDSFAPIKQAAIEYATLEKGFKVAPSRKEFLQLKTQEIKLQKLSADAMKAEQNNLIALEKTKQAAITTENKAITLANKKAAIQKRSVKLTAEEKHELSIINRGKREAAILSSKLSTEYEKQSLTLLKLRRKYKDVALVEGETSKKAQQLRIEIQKLDKSLKRVDANVGQYQRSVGNYGKALKGAAGAARGLMAAMGLAGGAFLFISVMRDAFKRVREFDKAMQNIAGIMRTTRNEIKDLEKEIIKVAGASVKTSNEVAKLAENLVTLGKTKAEIKDLLEPVNNLAIGLETTSGEAAEFLVQMLNTFGAGTEEAAKYADTIATIRTSTTLDFQKMRDSFQYLAPISRALNKDIAYTGALIGVLADNGIKAERAGRLLGTAQQKLAKDNLSLVDALAQINQAQREGKKGIELLAISSNLFGKQSAALGIVLANNTDIIETNAQAIRDNGGALDDLVNEQLESLDAKVKILDSTWEKFILNIDNGKGSISGFFQGFTEGLTGFISTLDEVSLASDGFFDFFAKLYQAQTLGGIQTMYAERIIKEEMEARIPLAKELAELKAQENAELIAMNPNLTKEAAIKAEIANLEGLNTEELQKQIDLLKEKGIKQDLISELLELDQKLKLIDLEKLSIKELKKMYKDLQDAKNGDGGNGEKDEKAAAERRKQILKDVFEYEKYLLQQKIGLNEDLIKDEDANIAVRLNAVKLKHDQELELAELQRDRLLENEELTSEGKKLILAKYGDDVKQINKNINDDLETVLAGSFSKAKERITEAQRLQEVAFNDEKALLQKSLLANEISVEDYEKKVLDLKKKYAVKSLEHEIGTIAAIIATSNLSFEARKEMEIKLAELKIALSNAQTENHISDAEDQAEIDKKLASDFSDFKTSQIRQASEMISESLGFDTQILDTFFNRMLKGFTESGIDDFKFDLEDLAATWAVVTEIGNAVFQNNINNIDEEITANEDKYALLIAAAEEDSIQKDLLILEAEKKRQELEAKKKKELTKQAKLNKAAAMVQAGINTALAITSALTFAPPASFVMAALAGVLGAVQIAAIASAPIPKFKDGHLSGTHKGLALVNDGGRDEVWERNGKAQIIKGRNVPINMERGDKIYKSVDDYQRIMRSSILSSVDINNNKANYFQAKQSFGFNDEALIREQQLTRKAIQGQKTNVYVPKQEMNIDHEIWKLNQDNWS